MVAHQAALPDTLSYEEPAGDLHPHHGVQHSLVDGPRPEGLLLGVGDLGGHVTDGNGDVTGRGGRKLDLFNSIQLVVSQKFTTKQIISSTHLSILPEGVQLRSGNLPGGVKKSWQFLDEFCHCFR